MTDLIMEANQQAQAAYNKAMALNEKNPDGLGGADLTAQVQSFLDEMDGHKAEARRLEKDAAVKDRLQKARELYAGAPARSGGGGDGVPYTFKDHIAVSRTLSKHRQVDSATMVRAYEYRKAFYSALAQDPQKGPQYDPVLGEVFRQAKAMNTTIGAEGGFLVDSMTEAGLIIALSDMNFMRSISSVSPMTGAYSTRRKLVRGVTALWEGETEDIGGNEANSQIDLVTFTPAKLRAKSLVSMEELEDADGVESILSEDATFQFATTEEKGFLIGDGVKKPLGIFTDANIDEIETAASGTLAADDIRGFAHELKAQYRAAAQWVLHRLILKEVMLFKDQNDQYLFQPSFIAGQPSTLAGLPINENEITASAVTAGAKAAVLGDFRYYHIRDRVGQTMQRLNELHSDTDEVAFIWRKRVTGQQILDEAFKRLVVKA